MTKITIISDAHFGIQNLKKIENIILESDYCIFLGDGINAVLPYKNQLGDRLVIVRGNCDFTAAFLDETVIDIDGHKILAAHGHNYRVKTTLIDFYYRAKELNADIALFGHTHIPYQEYHDGILLLNPGSIGSPRLSAPSYAYMILSAGKKPLARIVELAA
ncbi:MAG TPA: metallophosphoesterase [Clostridia bacterium]